MLKKPDFCEKFEYHNTRFKTKCKRLRADTSFYNIDWESASLKNIEHSNRELHNGTDSTAKTKPLTIHYLTVIFTSNDREYSIRFKGIKKLNNIWKLGSQIRMREIKNE